MGTEIAVMHTPDGGSTWYQQSVPANRGNRMMAVCFVDELHGWVVGSDGTILRTSTGNNLDALLLSGQQDFLIMTLGVTGIVIVVSAGWLILRRRKQRMSIAHTNIEPESTAELL